MKSNRELLIAAYQAFNARDIDTILAMMHPHVDWPNGMEGGRVHGQDNVREYWTRQWGILDPHVEPVRIEDDEAERSVARVHHMDRLEAIQTFVRVVETGSFSAPARELRIGQPTISKQVAGLEAHLGAELLKRSSRRVALTDAGRESYESAVHLLEEYDAATSRVGRGHVAPSGLVRAMVLSPLTRLYIVPRMGEFFDRYPNISVELLNFDRPANLIEEGIDVAIHSGDLSDSSLIAKKIAETSVVLVATPEYLEKHGTPKHPNQLRQHRSVAYMHQGAPRPWVFEKKSTRVVHHPDGNLRTSDAEQMRVAVLNHLGIANGPAWLFAKEIASGTVRRLFPEYERRKSIFALRAGGRRLAAKTTVFIDFLVEIFAKNPQFIP